MQNRTKDLDQIFQDGVLIDLQVGYWQARAANTTRDLGIAKSRDLLPDFIAGLGTKRLIDKNLVDTWGNLANRARYAITKRSFEFPIGKHRFIPLAALPAAEIELQDIKREFETSIDYLVRNYDAFRERMLSKSPEHRRALAGHFPAKRDLREKFYMTWTPFVLSLPRKAKVEIAKRESIATTVAERERLAKLRQADQERAERRYREHLETQMQGFLTEAVNTLRTKAVDLCTTIAAKVRSGEVVTDRNLNQMRRFVDQFAMMNFVGDDDVAAKLDVLKKTILDGRDADAFVTDEIMRQRLAGALDAIQDAAKEVTDLSKVTGTLRRKIAL